MERDYNFYRFKAGLDFNKFIELNPDKDGEELFSTFMKRFEIYYKQRDAVVSRYSQRFVNEKDEEKFGIIQCEKMYALAQLEQIFIDVIRVIFGLAPDDNDAIFGNCIENRYRTLVDKYMCKDEQDKGLYIGADGLYRVASFYDDDVVELSTMYRWYQLRDKAYNTDEPPEDSFDIEMYVGKQKIKMPDMPSKDFEWQLQCIANYIINEKHPKKEEEGEKKDLLINF